MKSNYINLEEKIIGEKLEKFRNSIFPFTLKIYKTLVESNLKNERIISAYAGIELTNFIRKALCLKPDDLYKKSLLIKVNSKGKLLTKFSNTRWEILLNQENISIKTYDIDHPYQKKFQRSNYSYLELLSIYNKTNLLYFLLKRFHFVFNYKKAKKIVLVGREDNLVREIIFHLVKNGITPIFLKNEKVEEKEFNKNIFIKLKEKLKPVILDYIKHWVSEEFHDKTINFYFLNLKKQLDLKESYKVYFDNYLGQFNKEMLCLTSYPAKPRTIALAEISEKKKIKFISTQHGINREINLTCDEGMCTWENGISDLLFVNNNESKIVSEKSPFAKGFCKVIGTAKQLYAKNKFDFPYGKKEVYYVSTRLSISNKMMLAGHLVDYEKTAQELKLIKNVFQKINKKIIFKTYPTEPLYLEKDPVYEEVSKSKNLKLLATYKDIQKYFKKMNLIITSRATSTLSWCLFSNVPLIFIDYPNQSMLKEKLVDEFKNSLFYFNSSKKTFFRDLRIFLNKPIQNIYQIWIDKEVSRNNLINQYFSQNQKEEAGEIASNFLLQENFFKKIDNR